MELVFNCKVVGLFVVGFVLKMLGPISANSRYIDWVIFEIQIYTIYTGSRRASCTLTIHRENGSSFAIV